MVLTAGEFALRVAVRVLLAQPERAGEEGEEGKDIEDDDDWDRLDDSGGVEDHRDHVQQEPSLDERKKP